MTIAEHQCERWKTRFGVFVRTFGTTELAHQLNIDPQAIYHWIRGQTSPRPHLARTIVSLASSTAVSLTLEDIYAQRDLHVDQN